MKDSVVTIVCTSYNYSQYISMALDSFLCQETDFPYDILVVDDCSTDNSREILLDYRDRYPDKISLVFNDRNKGLTRTWIDICDQVTAKYIARCDADDFWIDSKKLQKQFDLLESSENSKWCNTEFNIVDEENKTIYENVFKNGPIAYANTYSKMLATKGMTLPSSWMIETELMQKVNHMIAPDSVDDGFPMQLEFFHLTELTFIEDATVAYRMSSNSDSRPVDPVKMKYRIDGLLKTQLEYLNKYPEQSILDIAKIQAEHDAKQEWRIFEMGNLINHLQKDLEISINKLDELSQNVQELTQKNKKLSHEYNSVIHSRRWTIPTKILKFFRIRK
ncbi:glycosyltransferase [Streptococcus parasanguinis]|uniref:glycosyltransferase n=1 Tax=Streptococcus parasanguinis TaxID=1318 RepID=UPI0039C08FDE